MKILITGGAGYVGTELIHVLVTDPNVDQIVIYDNLIRSNYNLFLGKSKLETDKLSFVKADILDSRRLKKEIETTDIVFHLAAKVSTPFADHNPHEFDQINNWGTAEITYLVENSKVKKFIYASSVSVYGSSLEELDVGMQLNPKTFYGISKLNGEEHVRRLENSNIKTFILRLGNVYGYSRSMRFDSVINKFMFEANFANRIRVFGDGEQKRSFIHIERLTDILENICLTDFKAGTYNLVESTFSINEIVTAMKLVYPDLEMVYVNQNMSMRCLRVKPSRLSVDKSGTKKVVLENDLRSFKEKFTF